MIVLRGLFVCGIFSVRRCSYDADFSMKDLRNANALSGKAHTKLEPIFVTKNGYGHLVVVSIETYEHITGTTVPGKEIASPKS